MTKKAARELNAQRLIAQLEGRFVRFNDGSWFQSFNNRPAALLAISHAIENGFNAEIVVTPQG
jgi:hypothetical protein